MSFVARTTKWLRYAREHPWQAVGMLIVGMIPLALLHLFQRQVEAWEDDFLVKYGTTGITYAITEIIDFLARHPVWSILLFALSLLLGLLAHAYISTHPFKEFEKAESRGTEPKEVTASLRNDTTQVPPAGLHGTNAAIEKCVPKAPPSESQASIQVVVSHQMNDTAHTVNAEWKELAGRFEKLPNGIRADCQIDRKDQTTTYDLWTIHGDYRGNCETLCKYAGIVLLKSPTVLKHVSEVAQQQSNPVWRWLYFLKDCGLARSNGLPPISDDGTIHLLSSISDLAQSSARMCIDCAAQELVISLAAKDEAEVGRDDAAPVTEDVSVADKTPVASDPWLHLFRARQELETELQKLLKIEEAGIKIVPALKIGKDDGDYRRERIEHLKGNIGDISKRMDLVSMPRPKLTLDWRKEWREMEGKFRNLGDASIFADQTDQDNPGTWEIRSDKKTAKVEECKALCELGGSKLLASSPAIEIPGAVRSSETNWQRWLEFLKETQGFSHCYRISSTRHGKAYETQAGHIYNLAAVSRIACIKCVATTYAKQPG